MLMQWVVGGVTLIFSHIAFNITIGLTFNACTQASLPYNHLFDIPIQRH